MNKEKMAICYILTGGNLGDRQKIQAQTVEGIRKKTGRILAMSQLFETAPWGFDHELSFLNRVIKLETFLSPEDLLAGLLEIEQELGRVRKPGKAYEGRTMDLDILYYEDLMMDQENLTIPHPRIHERNFTLAPLFSLNPDLFDPRTGKTVREMIKECPDTLEAKPLQDCAITT